MGEGIGLGNVLVVGAVCRLAFLCENHGHVVEVAEQCGNGNAACLDGEDFVHLFAAEPTFELVSYLSNDIDVDLMVEEVVNL